LSCDQGSAYLSFIAFAKYFISFLIQGRVRECLVNLLTTCGQRVGLPKSPSVSFILIEKLTETETNDFNSNCFYAIIFVALISISLKFLIHSLLIILVS
jgi:hypothetical protein